MEIDHSLREVQEVLSALNLKEVQTLVDLLYEAYLQNRYVFVIGNGGSAANASHFAQDLVRGTLKNPLETKRLRALSLTDNVAYITALANDEGYETVFEQQLMTLANPDDILIAISGSGNSENIIRAVRFAKTKGMTTVGICGFDGGRLKQLADRSVHVPINDMFLSESIHAIIFHLVITAIREKIRDHTN